MDIPAQELKNPLIEGFLEKRRPSKRYLSLKYQKRWCVIHQDKFYYYESITDKKPKGVFSLEGYTFFEKENRLTFDLKCSGRRTFEFICSSNAELKQWRKAIRTASLYRCGPTGKKKRELGVLPEEQITRSSSQYQDDDIFADPNEIKKHVERSLSKDNHRRHDQSEIKNQLERSHSQENVVDRGPVPSPRSTRNHKRHHRHEREHDIPKGQRSKNLNESRSRPVPPPDVNPSSITSPNRPSSSDDYGYITVNKGPRKIIKHSDLVKDPTFQNSNSVSDDNEGNGNEPLYLELLGDNQLPSKNGPIKQTTTGSLSEDPIYQNTNDPSLQYTTVLPKKMREVNIESPYSTANKNNDVLSDSDEYTSSSEKESSDSDLDDYENAQMFGLSHNAH